jgi:ABC-2 type transport system permease protein
MTAFLMPMWFLSGAFFPVAGVPVWLAWVMTLNPLTYGMGALRRILYLDRPEVVDALPALAVCLTVTVVFALAMLVLATLVARNRSLETS